MTDAGSASVDDPRRVLTRHGLHAKKTWGQNFLVDRTIHERVVRAARLAAEDVVVEIGAGVGTLTAALAQAGPRRIVAVERDPDLVGVLRAEMASRPAVEIRAVDALTLDLAAEARTAGRPLVVVGNIPYQITSPLVFMVLEARGAVARAILMMQKEVAMRLVAPPGGKIRGRLSVMAQQAAEVRVLFHVGPGAFHPPPKVTSSVVSFVPRAQPLAPVRDAALFERVVREAFGTRRKMLRRALAPAFGDAAVARALTEAGVDGQRRAETLEVAEFGRLADALAQRPDGAGADVVPSPSGAGRPR